MLISLIQLYVNIKWLFFFSKLYVTTNTKLYITDKMWAKFYKLCFTSVEASIDVFYRHWRRSRQYLTEAGIQGSLCKGTWSCRVGGWPQGGPWPKQQGTNEWEVQALHLYRSRNIQGHANLQVGFTFKIVIIIYKK